MSNVGLEQVISLKVMNLDSAGSTGELMDWFLSIFSLPVEPNIAKPSHNSEYNDACTFRQGVRVSHEKEYDK